jgi:hypothetical protein
MRVRKAFGSLLLKSKKFKLWEFLIVANLRIRALENTLKQVIESDLVLSDAKKLAGLNAVGKRAIELIRERISKGLDVRGQRLKAFTKSYKEFKRLYIKGRRRTPDSRGKYAARKLPNHIRLSGQLMGSLRYNITNFKVNLVLNNDRAKDKVGWLKKDWGRARNGKRYKKASRDIWGIAKRGTNRGRYEREELRKAFLKAIK